MDAGGLAQMTYNSSFNNGGSLGVPSSGFASRGKGSHIKRLNVPPQISAVGSPQSSATISTPRTSRSHLLAGLRTAPKSATVPSAQHERRVGLQGSRHAISSAHTAERVPQTATGAGFPQYTYGINPTTNLNMNFGLNLGRPLYSLPEQVLGPPAIDFGDGDGMDEKLFTELMSTNLLLAAQQQRLQQQLINVTAAAQGLNLGLPIVQQQQQPPQTTPYLPGMSLYQQQLQQGIQPIVQAVPGQPGLFSVYNPMTGQQSFVIDNTIQQADSPPTYRDREQEQIHSVGACLPPFRAEVSPPPESTASPAHSSRAPSPPKNSPSPPADMTSFPPPSTGAFRRNHKKSSSFLPSLKENSDSARTGSAGPRSAIFPPTPLTGTFGPGQGRAGEHPIRQPRGPPSLEELVAKPTSKHEGSKNFATRQRRRAVHSLVRAGIERRGESRSHGSSGGSSTPASETEFVFSPPEGDAGSQRSGSLSSRPSLGSLRAAANGAIGSELKEKDRSSREPSSIDSLYAASTVSSDEASKTDETLMEIRSSRVSIPAGPPLAAAVVAGQITVSQGPERRKTPMLVLSSAEKRKTPTM